jgi:hypothetical protein
MDRLPALATLLGALLVTSVARAENFDGRAGGPIEGAAADEIKAAKAWGHESGAHFYALKDDPNLMIYVPYRLNLNPRSLACVSVLGSLYASVAERVNAHYSTSLAALDAEKKKLDTYESFGVPAVKILATGTFHGDPAMLVPRYERPINYRGDGAVADDWNADVVPEKTLAALDQLEAGVDRMEKAGYSVRLDDLMFEKSGRVLVRANNFFGPPRDPADGGLPAPNAVGNKNHSDSQHVISLLRRETLLIAAALKCGASIKEIRLARALDDRDGISVFYRNDPEIRELAARINGTLGPLQENAKIGLGSWNQWDLSIQLAGQIVTLRRKLSVTPENSPEKVDGFLKKLDSFCRDGLR